MEFSRVEIRTKCFVCSAYSGSLSSSNLRVEEEEEEEEEGRISRARKIRCGWCRILSLATLELISLPLSLPPSLQGKSIQVLCLEGFSQLLQVVDSRYPTRMAVFLSRLHPGCDETTDTAEKIHFYIEHFQVGTVSLLSLVLSLHSMILSLSFVTSSLFPSLTHSLALFSLSLSPSFLPSLFILPLPTREW